MALQRALEAAFPPERRLVEDPLAVAFLDGPLRAAAWLARIPALGRLITILYDLVWPGPRPSAIARTRLIDDTVAKLVAGGVAQLVILGAGYDSRAWRLPALDGVRVIEVDQADTQGDKLSRLQAGGHDPGAVSFAAVDFETERLGDAIDRAGLDAAAPAVWLWEGVTNYLSADAVDRTLAAIRAVAAPGSWLLFTYVHRGALEGTTTFPEARRWVRSVARVGEPWTFGLDPAQLDGFLHARGFALRWECTTAEAGRRYFPAVGRSELGSELYRIALATV